MHPHKQLQAIDVFLFVCFVVVVAAQMLLFDILCGGLREPPPSLPFQKHTRISDRTAHATAGLVESDGWKHGNVQLCAHSETGGAIASGGCVYVGGGCCRSACFSGFGTSLDRCSAQRRVELPNPRSVTAELTQTDSSVIKNNINFIC